jgi:hypothetical protein
MNKLLNDFRLLLDMYEHTGNMDYLFNLERELESFLDTVVDDYLEETNYDNVSNQFYTQNINEWIDWTQNHTRE